MLDKWDQRFMDVARLVASWSKDPSTKVGAVLVHPQQKRIVSTGYNGYPRSLEDDGGLDRDRKLSRTIHAEMNAILHAREPTEGLTLYVTPLPPCDRCAAHIIQAGIRRVVYAGGDLGRWASSASASLAYFGEAGIEVMEFTANDASA
ncbi:deoxycytidylate deaminase [Frateuria aurantia]|uniref:Deoxycytidylate deaminase n=1 Tax=Frateuria aurantia (strain ATCC 33424 / DSM 6220 / KCTC 2777 / LMG 1558 / NBRC 3245 / NCIMB 13370) TaxID=767434 RepID=H8L4Y2_FRAAD|nr:dCMP deaminase family protein [Frateuria aurantia]AFC85696.1 deoxycytidylate deaminase [Frateuria aurantia DSM 6220]